MKFDTLFSIKDFFNYYFPGVIWICIAMLVLLPGNNSANWIEAIEGFNRIGRLVDGAIWLLLLIIFPYILGVAFNPIASTITRILRTKFRVKEWVTGKVPIAKKFRMFPLPQWELNLIEGEIEKIYGLKKRINVRTHFHRIRAIASHESSAAYALAIRASDMANFCEAMLLPAPLLVFAGSVKILEISTVGSLVFSLVLFCLLAFQYMHFRFYWEKHSYRAFLAIATARQTNNNSPK